MTISKIKSSAAAAEAMVNLADAAAQEARIVAETMLDSANSTAEKASAVMAVQQEVMHSNLKMWQQCNRAYFDFMIDASQRSLEQSLAWRERLAKIVEGNLKLTQERLVAEQVLALGTAETYQDQMRTAVERVARLLMPFTPN